MTRASCLYEGRVRHRRFAPVAHEFSYSLFMMYLDLAELPDLFRGRWLWSARGFDLAWFRRADHHGDPATPLDLATRDLVERECGRRPAGPIRLLTHLRYLGYGFNPVSFYYCWDEADRNVEAVVAEINNTPWGEQHCYVLDASRNEGTPERMRFRFAKAFHISPFIGMDVEYDWRFGTPGKELAVHMEDVKRGAGEPRFFDATLTLARTEITGGALARVLVQYPWMTAKVIAAIYFQSWRLWRKRAPFFPHPGGSAGTAPAPAASGPGIPEENRR